MLNKSAPYDVCAIGNICIDIIDTVGDDFLQAHRLRKSVCTYINALEVEEIRAGLTDPILAPGGAGANVAHVVAALGGASIFQGKGSQDSYTGMIRKDLEERGILTHIPVAVDATLQSSQVFCLDTPDGDRSFASYDGSAKTFGAADLNLGYIAQSKITYFDSYTFISADTEDAFIAAHQASAEAGNLCCFNPCDLAIIEHYPSALEAVMNCAEMFICNVNEARALFGEKSAADIASSLSGRYRAGAITEGDKGAYVFLNGETVFIPPCDTSSLKVIHSNGAGDHFAGGFLFGLSRDYPLTLAGKLGSLCARDCLTHPEARPLGSLVHLVTSLTES